MLHIIVSAHGGRFSNQRQTLRVPPGLSINYYCLDGQILSNNDGYWLFNHLQNGYDVSQYVRQRKDEGEFTFDYSCWFAPEFAAYCGIFELGNPDPIDSLRAYSQANPLLLSQIFARYSGTDCVIEWLCCRTVTAAFAGAQLSNPKGAFLTEAAPETALVPDLVPGASMLGLGFNALGTYDVRSLTQQIISVSAGPDTNWTYPPTKITYTVPGNASVISNTHASGSARVFSSQQEFQDYFSAKADIEGSYGGFSAQFSAAYSKSLTTTDSYSYSVYDAEFRGWDVMLLSHSEANQVPGFSQDPDVVELPRNFTKENRESFFALFRKFGTHFVSQCRVGGNIYYYLAIEKAYSVNTVALEAKVALEYKAVFTAASGEAEADWSQLGEEWATSRSVQVSALGGSAHVLNALLPVYQSSFNTIFLQWQDGVMQNPAVVTFKLRPLSQLFSGEQAGAVSKALRVYMNGAIISLASCDYTPGTGPGGGNVTTDALMIVAGNLIPPDPLSPPPPPVIEDGVIYPITGYRIVVVDADSLDVILNATYYIPGSLNSSYEKQQEVYHKIMKDIDQIGERGYYVAISGFGIIAVNFPSSAFMNWVSSCGIDMRAWRSYMNQSMFFNLVSYAAVGRQGLNPGKAVESFSVWLDDWTLVTEGGADASVITMLYADTLYQETPGMTRGSLSAG